MIASCRCTTGVVALILVALMADVQAFTSLAVRKSGNSAGHNVLRNRPGIRATRTTKGLGTNSRRTANREALAMSEMEEDYPSDTGDDRFSTGGKHRQSLVNEYLVYTTILICNCYEHAPAVAVGSSNIYKRRNCCCTDVPSGKRVHIEVLPLECLISAHRESTV